MYVIVEVTPTAWGAVVHAQGGDEAEVVDAWFRKQMRRVVDFQRERGGGIFFMPIPEDLAVF